VCGKAERVHSARRNYTEPAFVKRSASDVAQFLRDRFSRQPQLLGRGASADDPLTPILLVQGCRSDSRSIQEAAQSRNLRGDSCVVPSGSELAPMLCQGLEWTGSPCPDFFLLDLRVHSGDSSDIVSKIRSEPRLRDIPLMILAAEGPDAEFSQDGGARNVWRARGISDPVLLVEALLALLRLSAEIRGLVPYNR
jgi:CheY-like chemotaxis protein